MRKFYKQLMAIILVIAVSISFIPVSGYAKERLVDYKGIDYTRIHADHQNSVMEVTLSLGGYGYTGQLMLGNNVSRHEANQVIQDVLEEAGLHEGDLVKMQSVINKAIKAYGINSEDILGAVGGDVWTVFDASSGKYGEYMAELNDGDMSHMGEMVALALGAAAGALTLPEGILGTIAGALLSLGITETGKILQSLEDGNKGLAMEAIQAARVMNSLYNKINKKLDGMGTKQTKQIVFDGHLEMRDNKTLFGIGGNELGIKVSGVLEGGEASTIGVSQSQSEKCMIFSGIYEGPLKIEAFYNAKGFDEKFQNDIFMTTPMATNSNGFYEFKDIYTPTVLRKELFFDSVTITVDARKERYGRIKESAVNTGKGNDTSVFIVNHTIRGNWTPAGFSEGEFHLKAGPTSTDLNNYVEYSFNGELLQNKYASLILSGSYINYSGILTRPMFSREVGDIIEASVNKEIMNDNNVFAFLSKQPRLYIDLNTYAER